MSTETPNPQPGDRVRVTFDATYVREADGQHVVDVADGMGPIHIALPAWASVEVLERADDPSKALIGEVRAYGGVPAVCYGRDFWVYFRADGGNGYGVYRDAQMVGTPVVGVVPGTPAAEADPETQLLEAVRQMPQVGESVEQWSARTARPQVRVPNEPHGLPIPVRQQAADRLIAGDVPGAVAAVVSGGLTCDQAERYVRDMEEWQTYLNHHGRTEVDPTEADRMRAMGFAQQTEFKLTDEQRAEIREALWERQSEFHIPDGTGVRRLEFNPLAGVVADIVWAAIKRDRERGDR